VFLLAVSVACTAPSAFAQNWSGDARQIAMGGVGTSQNLASSMIADEKGYRTIVIPLGLFQVLRNLDIFNPESDEFDIVRSVEYAAAPLHYTFDRDGSDTGAEFVNALRNAELSRDLNDYRGFIPVTQPVAYGLGNPNFGLTIPVYRTDRTRHGVYVGAGPYFAFRGDLTVDDQFINIMSSESPLYLPNTAIPFTTNQRGEMALAITGGYRGKYALPVGGSGDEREGIDVALNYNYLRGYVYEDADIGLRLDTDAAGFLTVNPALPPPIVLARQSSTSGRGFAIDFGVAAFVNRWEFGGGVNGIANRIEWRDVEGTAYTLGDIFNSGDFSESPEVPLDDVTIEQPVEYTGNVGYHADNWTGIAQISQRTTSFAPDEGRFNGTSFRTGFEYRFGPLSPRVGAFYTRERWQPSAGIGFSLLPSFGIDVATYLTDANVQRERHPVFAVSVRIGRRPSSPAAP
jgi:hypothetical protein